MTLKTSSLDDKKTDYWAEATASKEQENEATATLDFVFLGDILQPTSGSYSKLPIEQMCA